MSCTALRGEQKRNCEAILNACRQAAGWPVVISTGSGQIEIPSMERCISSSKSLAEFGYKFISSNSAPAAAPALPAVPSSVPPAARPATGMGGRHGGSGYCTEKTGFVPANRASLQWGNGSIKFSVDGKVIVDASNPVPILDSSAGPSGKRVILLPYREAHFRLNSAQPVNKSAFDRTVGQMIGDIANVISGPFSKACGLDYLKEFSGNLTLYVVGKTDRLGSEDHNRQLSIMRARAVAEAINSKRGELGRMLVAGSRGLLIKYMGAGEGMTRTEDDVASPEHRRVELYLTTEGAPMAGQWMALTGSGTSINPRDAVNYYCSGADGDCRNAVAQCEASLKIMCSEAHPFDDDAQKSCASGVGASMAAGVVQDEGVKRWLGNGYFSFPLMYMDGTRKGVERVDSLKKCLVKSPAIADRYSVSPNAARWMSARDVSNARAVRGVMPRGSNYCSARNGWMNSSRNMLTKTPRGELLWYDNNPVGVLGVDEWIAIRTPYRNSIVKPYHKIDLSGSNLQSTAATIANEVLDFALGGTFMSRCSGLGASPLVRVEFSSHAFSPKEKGLIDRFISMLETRLALHGPSIKRNSRVELDLVEISPSDAHKGLYVTTTIPLPERHSGNVGSYNEASPRPGRDGAIKVIPLK